MKEHKKTITLYVFLHEVFCSAGQVAQRLSASSSPQSGKGSWTLAVCVPYSGSLSQSLQQKKMLMCYIHFQFHLQGTWCLISRWSASVSLIALPLVQGSEWWTGSPLNHCTQTQWHTKEVRLEQKFQHIWGISVTHLLRSHGPSDATPRPLCPTEDARYRDIFSI